MTRATPGLFYVIFHCHPYLQRRPTLPLKLPYNLLILLWMFWDSSLSNSKYRIHFPFLRSFKKILLLGHMLFLLRQLLTPFSTLQLDGHSFSVVHDCLFNAFAATLHTSKPCSDDMERVCSQTQLCQLWCFNDYTTTCFGPYWPSSRCLQENLRCYYIQGVTGGTDQTSGGCSLC